jgi:hypothetical protein
LMKKTGTHRRSGRPIDSSFPRTLFSPGKARPTRAGIVLATHLRRDKGVLFLECIPNYANLIASQNESQAWMTIFGRPECKEKS